MLFRLNTIRAVVRDLPMQSRYGTESSHLRVRRVLVEFPLKHLNRFFKRLIYLYFLRDFNIGTVQGVAGVLLLLFGAAFGVAKWAQAAALQREASAGTVMIATLPIIVGIQLLLSALQYEVANVPKQPLSSK